MDAAAATPAALREKAKQYRDLVRLISDQRIVDALMTLADEYDERANRLEREG